MIGVTSLFATFEISKILNSKGFITLSFVIVTIISNIIAPMSIIIMFISGIMHVIASAVYFYFAIKEKGLIRYQAFFTGLGILAVLIGATLRPSDIKTIFPNLVQIFQANIIFPVEIYPFFLIYAGLLLMVVFQVNFIIRLQWMKQIKSVYLITHSGTPLLEKYFDDKKLPPKSSPDKSIDIKNILNKIDIEKKVEKMDCDGLKIILGYGDRIIGVLVVNEALMILSKKLKEYIKDFEELFRDVLPKLENVNLEIFKPAYVLLNRHFSPAS
ncbi:MAG: hypothetical protein HWN67_06445 [Candidatus Helarchaeota archaeon]|nr:hypothetical protein [Candidatus Helarchaeota archaeon]